MTRVKCGPVVDTSIVGPRELRRRAPGLRRSRLEIKQLHPFGARSFEASQEPLQLNCFDDETHRQRLLSSSEIDSIPADKPRFFSIAFDGHDFPTVG